jgi:hypothetical protein
MALAEIVKQALENGSLNLEQQTAICQICHPDTVLSAEENIYLDQLLGAILTGEVAGLFWYA